MSADRPLGRDGVLRPPPEFWDGLSPAPRPDPIDPRLQALIGEQLRAMYGKLVDQPVPDRLLALVERLGERERSGNGEGSS